MYLDVEMIIGEVEEGFRDVGLLTMHTAPRFSHTQHPSGAHHHPRLLCLLLGQKRTCKGGVIMFPVDSEELTLSCYLLECVYCSYVLLI